MTGTIPVMMTGTKMSRAWCVAATPPVLLLLVAGVGFLIPFDGAPLLLLWTVGLLVASLLPVGLGVLFYVLRGWRRGRFPLRRADIRAAMLIASLDLLLACAAAVLLWMLAQSLSHMNLIM
jgi:hypothetical protein